MAEARRSALATLRGTYLTYLAPRAATGIGARVRKRSECWTTVWSRIVARRRISSWRLTYTLDREILDSGSMSPDVVLCNGCPDGAMARKARRRTLSKRRPGGGIRPRRRSNFGSTVDIGWINSGTDSVATNLIVVL
ncbi:uncharacterized protein LOC112453727 [Temnothorax curvispinosus]|uniref:Uncharacterized protein LOC112453727 n=1 Tax=Temnothorax curvispinosus TaxID=300111 RepID=A0A6J1PMP7_9HYME|nr:uncharacterized protein LOC112453727 [Temnothorax curvispinosus]